MKTTLQVACGLIQNKNGDVLLAQRPSGSKMAGLWEFPGGKIEVGESSEAALIRELFEELCLTISKPLFLTQTVFEYPWATVNLHSFHANALNDPRPTESVHVFKWVNPSQIHTIELCPADIEPLKFWLNPS